MKKRLLAILLAVVMTAALLPAALAASGGSGGGTVIGGGTAGDHESSVDDGQVCMVLQTEAENSIVGGRLLAELLFMDGTTQIVTVSAVSWTEGDELVSKAVVGEVTDPTSQIDTLAAQAVLTGTQDADALNKFFFYDATSNGYELTELNDTRRWEDPVSRYEGQEEFATISPVAAFVRELGGDAPLADWAITANMNTTFVVGKFDPDTAEVTYSAYQGFQDLPEVDIYRITAICENLDGANPSAVNTVARFVYLERLPSVEQVGDFMIEDNDVLIEYIGLGGDVTIPDGVIYIGEGAFSASYGHMGGDLTSVTIPDSVISIEEYAFEGCTGLTSVAIPDSVTYIGGSAFYGCDSLASVTIPHSVTYIEADAFGETPWLKNMGEFPVVNGILLAYQGEGGDVVIPEGVTTVGADAFYGCKSLTGIIIPNGVTSVNVNAFRGCTGLTSVLIPEGCTRIGPQVFYECGGLTSVTIPESVTTIGANVFAGRYGTGGGLGGGFQKCPDGMTVYGKAGSYAERYCAAQGIPFAILPGTERTGAMESDGGQAVEWDVTVEGQVTVDATDLAPEEAVLVGCYDNTGKFAGVKWIDTSSPEAQIDPDTPNVKLFWLGAAQRPQSPSVTVWGK